MTPIYEMVGKILIPNIDPLTCKEKLKGDVNEYGQCSVRVELNPQDPDSTALIQMSGHNNPGVLATLEIHRAKNTCIEEEICDPEAGDWEGDECRFNVSRVNAECPTYHPSLKDFKIAKRHLDVEVDMGELGWDPSTKEYIYRSI
jgi:hypothetical protein